MLNGSLDEFLQCRQVNVRESLDIDTALAAGVFAQLSQQFFALLEFRHQIEGDVLLAGRKRDHHPIHLAPVGILVSTVSETDDARPPHPAFRFRRFFHHRGNRPAVLADLFFFYGVEKVVDRLGREFGLQLSCNTHLLRRDILPSPVICAMTG